MKPNSNSRPRASRVRHVPFGLAPFDEFGRVLGRFISDLPARSSSLADLASEFAPDGFRPCVELAETATGLRLVAELPGIPESEIDLRVEDGHLILAGEKRAEARSEKDEIVHTERRFSSFRRTLPLPFEVDLERTEATYQDGVLTVELRRAEASEPERRIPVRRTGESTDPAAS